jgi:hypothetical protein
MRSDYKTYLLKQLGLKESQTTLPLSEEDEELRQNISPTALRSPVIGLAVRGSSTGGFPSGLDQTGLSPDTPTGRLGGYEPVPLNPVNSKIFNKTPTNVQMNSPSPIDDNPQTTGAVTHPHQVQKYVGEPPQDVTGASTDSNTNVPVKVAPEQNVDIDIPGGKNDMDGEENMEDEEKMKSGVPDIEGDKVQPDKQVNEHCGHCGVGEGSQFQMKADGTTKDPIITKAAQIIRYAKKKGDVGVEKLTQSYLSNYLKKKGIDPNSDPDLLELLPEASQRLNETFERHKKLMQDKLGLIAEVSTCKCGNPDCTCKCKMTECGTCGCGKLNTVHSAEEGIGDGQPAPTKWRMDPEKAGMVKVGETTKKGPITKAELDQIWAELHPKTPDVEPEVPVRFDPAVEPSSIPLHKVVEPPEEDPYTGGPTPDIQGNIKLDEKKGRVTPQEMNKALDRLNRQNPAAYAQLLTLPLSYIPAYAWEDPENAWWAGEEAKMKLQQVKDACQEGPKPGAAIHMPKGAKYSYQGRLPRKIGGSIIGSEVDEGSDECPSCGGTKKIPGQWGKHPWQTQGQLPCRDCGEDESPNLEKTLADLKARKDDQQAKHDATVVQKRLDAMQRRDDLAENEEKKTEEDVKVKVKVKVDEFYAPPFARMRGLAGIGKTILCSNGMWSGQLKEGVRDEQPCDCGSGDMGEWEFDAQGIPLCRCCPKCRREKLSKYRPEILTGYGQGDVDEPIEPDDPSDLTETEKTDPVQPELQGPYPEATIQMNKMGSLHVWQGAVKPVQIAKYRWAVGDNEGDVYIQNDSEVEEVLSHLTPEERRDVEAGWDTVTKNFPDEYFQRDY